MFCPKPESKKCWPHGHAARYSMWIPQRFSAKQETGGEPRPATSSLPWASRPAASISLILDFSRRLTMGVVHAWSTPLAPRSLAILQTHPLCVLDKLGSAPRARHRTQKLVTHVLAIVRQPQIDWIFPSPNNRCCSGANGRLPSHAIGTLGCPSQQ